MDRFLMALGLCALLAFAPDGGVQEAAQPVFFSMLFPQLIPDTLFDSWWGHTPGEAVAL